jgi:hypothetical protein
MTDAAVRGSAFIEPVRHVKAALGVEGLQRIARDAGPEVSAALSVPLRKIGWYPYATFVDFLRAIDRAMGKGDFAYGHTLGVAAGKRDLGTVFRIYAALASPERLIRGCAKVWEGYYRDAGTMRATSWTPESTVLVIEGFPEMHPIHCRLMEGWMIATMENIGYLVQPGSRETQCVSRGGTCHEFTATWRKG